MKNTSSRSYRASDAIALFSAMNAGYVIMALLNLLRFSGGTLEASAHDQPDRIDVRDGAAPDAADEGVWLSAGHTNDGLQAGPGSGGDASTGIILSERCFAGCGLLMAKHRPTTD